MMRLPACVLASIFAVFPAAALALALGNVEVSTTLNEPLRAEIPITGIRPGDVDQIDVRLGTDEQFRRAGIERPFHLTGLKFKVVPDGERKARLEVTSKGNITEPFLNFLIEINWPTGRMIREYTVLLDPPVYGAAISSARNQSIARAESLPETAGASAPTPLPGSETAAAPEPQPSPPAPVTPPRAAQPAVAAPEPAPEPQPAPTRQPAPTTQPDLQPAPAPAPDFAATSAPELAGVDRYGPVIANESLWSIAARTRPDEGISIQRMMLAILQANRDAFFLDNINSLKKGEVLRIPGRDEIGADEKALAMAEVRRQQAIWDDYRRALAGTPAVAPEGTQAAAPSITQSEGAVASGGEDASRLQLLAAGASPNAGAPGDQANLSQLKQELNMALEEADSKQRENQELSERLSETERIISDLNRMLELKDDEIASLQNQLRQDEAAPAPAPQPEASVAATTPEPEPSVATSTSEPEPSVATAMPEPAPSTAATTSEPAPAPAATTQPQPAPQPKPKPVARPPQPQPQQLSFVDELLNTARGYVPSGVDPILLAGGLGIVLILGGGLALYRRRQATDGGAEPAAIDFEDDQAAIADVDDDLFRDDTEPSEEDQTELAPEAEPHAGTGDAAVATVDSADEDPLSELNIYMAYEHFDQAEDLVRRAIADSPDRHDYRLKLLEVFYAAKDLPSFQEAARELRDAAGADSPLMATAAGWWEDLAPGRELFGGPQAQPGAPDSSGTAVEGGDGEVFDVTGGGTSDTEESAVDFDLSFETTGAGGQEDSLGSSVDFNLDSGETAPAAADSGSEVEFDLSDLGGDTNDDAASAGSGDFQFEAQKNGGAAAVNADSGELDFDVAAVEEGADQSPDLADSAFDMDLNLGDAAEEADNAEAPAADAGLDFEFDGTHDETKDDVGGGMELELESFQESDTNTEADGDLTAMDERLDRDSGAASEAPDQIAAFADDDLGLDFDIGDELDDGSAALDDQDLAIGMDSDDSIESSGIDFDIEGGTDAESSLASSGASGSSDVDFEIGGEDASDQKFGIDTQFDGVFGDSDAEALAGGDASDADSNEDPLGIAGGDGELPQLDTDTEDAVDLTFLGDAGGTGTNDPLAEFEFGDENTSDEKSDDADHTEYMLREVPQPDSGDTASDTGETSGELDDIQTKLDLAEAYIEMGDTDGARGILGEVVNEGSQIQQDQAKNLLQKLG